jgi:hypothetical protein
MPPIGDMLGGVSYYQDVGRFILFRLVVLLRQCRYGVLVLWRPSWFAAEEERGVCFFVEMGVVERVIITSTPNPNTKSSVETKIVRKLLSVISPRPNGATEWRSSYEFLTVRRPSLLTPSKSSVSRSGDGGCHG